MATKYNEYPPEDSDFAMMRDGIYMLAVMNQCEIVPSLQRYASSAHLEFASRLDQTFSASNRVRETTSTGPF